MNTRNEATNTGKGGRFIESKPTLEEMGLTEDDLEVLGMGGMLARGTGEERWENITPMEGTRPMKVILNVGPVDGREADLEIERKDQGQVVVKLKIIDEGVGRMLVMNFSQDDLMTLIRSLELMVTDGPFG